MAFFPGIGGVSETGTAFAWTSTVTKTVNDLNVDVDNVNRDITNWFKGLQGKQTAEQAAFANAWIAWRNNVYGMIKSWRGYGFEWAGSAYDRVVGKAKELKDWRDMYESKTKRQSTSPAPRVPPNADDGTADSPWKWVAIGLGGAAATALLVAKLK